MNRSMGSVYASIFHRKVNKFPGNGGVSGGVEGHAGPNEVNDQPSELPGLREPVLPEASGYQAPPAHSPRTSEFDFMSMLTDPAMNTRADRSAAMQ